jgi:hypothetical protein
MSDKKSRGFTPNVVNLRSDRHEEIRSKYGDYVALDVTNFIMGITEDMPRRAPCGCGISRGTYRRIVDARDEYDRNEVEGKKLYALLGSFSNGDSGPLVTLRLDDGTIVIMISPRIATSNPTMTITDGDVRISSTNSIRDDLRTACKSGSVFTRVVDKLSSRRSRFKLVESVRGGTTISLSSLRTYDYSLVHPHSHCRRSSA